MKNLAILLLLGIATKIEAIRIDDSDKTIMMLAETSVNATQMSYAMIRAYQEQEY